MLFFMPLLHLLLRSLKLNNCDAAKITYRLTIPLLLLLLLVSLYLLTVTCFLKPASAGVSRCWRMCLQAALWISAWRMGSEQMFPIRPVEKTLTVPTLLLGRRLYCYGENLPVHYVICNQLRRKNCTATLEIWLQRYRSRPYWNTDLRADVKRT